jgi:hypothetical protein
MGFSPQLVKREIDRNLLLHILGKTVNLRFEDFTISGRLIKFERVGEARHKPFILVLLLSDGRTVITKWEGIIYWK